MAFPEAMAAIQTHMRAAEALAALGAKLGTEAGRIRPGENLLSKIDNVHSRFEPDLLDGLDEDELDALYGFVRAGLRQVLHLVELPDEGADGWAYDDPAILESQGRSSRLVTRLISEYAGKNSELGKLFSGGAEFLDVGSGVGWISLSMAQQWPKLKATGIDILSPALELASLNLERTGLSERVCFRQQNVVDLQEEEAFDAIFIPVIFIPETIMADAFERLFRALRPNGWLFAAGYRVPEDELLAALNDLKTALSGGRVWAMDELVSLVSGAGFTPLEDVGTGSALHLLAARREA